MQKQTMKNNFSMQLEKWQNEIAQLESRANELKAESKARFEEQTAALKEMWRKAQQQLAELEDAGEGSWDRISHNLQQTIDNLKQSFDRAAQMAGNSIGWPEGVAEKRARNSEGWAEGFGKEGKPSKGWPEGLAEETEHNSKGWQEGYEEKSTA